ncbi:MAG: transglutaminase domain-containing protein [Calditrichaeota bacterium]|nr:MAG: transglutaminase domain-containing protein [Calditrichota bacterium]
MLTHAFILLLIFFVPILKVNAQESKFLQSKTIITFQNENSLIIRREENIFIATESDKDLGFDSVRESPFVKLRKMDAAIYDTSGKKLVKLKKKDIKQSSVSPYSIYTEHRTKYYQLSYPQLPYRLWRLKEFEIKSAFFWPDWDPQEHVAVEKAELELILKQPFEFEYENVGKVLGPEIITDEKGHKHYIWKAENIPAFESEFRYAPEAAFQIGVKFIPKYFSLDGVRGSLTSWQDFGAWYFRLIQDNLRLAPQHPIPDSLLSVKDVKERIRRLYRYLQEKTRYVQIYLGIDGWKPHRVIDIHQNKYGDCKDLSVYMIAMLAKAGIKAYPALVLTRDRGWVNPKIPANHFNHCVVTVPMEKDTLWLECTSDTSPFNDPPASIEGVNVLVVKPDGGKLVRTPLSEARENQSICIARAQLLPDRSLTMEGHVAYTGNRAINMRSFLLNTDAKKQRKIFSRRFAGKGGDVLLEKFQISGLNNPDTTLTIKFRVRIPFFARKAGTRLIIQPRIFHQINFEGEPPEKRTMPLLNLTRFVDQDSIFFKLPQNFAPKISSYQDSTVSRFGSYLARWQPHEDGWLWSSSFACTARKISLQDYPEYYQFMTKVVKSSRKKIILRRRQ